MTPTRLNNVAVSHEHQDLLDACDIDEIELFISTCESRIKLFVNDRVLIKSPCRRRPVVAD